MKRVVNLPNRSSVIAFSAAAAIATLALAGCDDNSPKHYASVQECVDAGYQQSDCQVQQQPAANTNTAHSSGSTYPWWLFHSNSGSTSTASTGTSGSFTRATSAPVEETFVAPRAGSTPRFGGIGSIGESAHFSIAG